MIRHTLSADIAQGRERLQAHQGSAREALLDLLPEFATAAGFHGRRAHMSHEQIGRVLGNSKESARKLVEAADESADFADAKLRREARRARHALTQAVEDAAEAKRRRLVAGKDQLVQIRPRPTR